MDKGQILYEEGDDGLFMYILRKGKLQLSAKGTIKEVYDNWALLCEESLMQIVTRTETVKCIELSELYLLSGVKYRENQSNINKLILKDRLYFLDIIPVFSIIIFILRIPQ